MLNAIIVDDEPNNLDSITLLLEKNCPNVHVAGVALNAESARKLITKVNPSLVFLDIQMPNENGFQLLQSLPAISFEVIFVTAYDQYGIQAIKLSALDYLLKPVNIDDLKQAVSKAEQRQHTRQQQMLLQNLLQHVHDGKNKQPQKLGLPTAKETKLVNIPDIIRCESSNSYTTFYLSDKEKVMVSRPIKEYEELLNGYGFIRVHQSHLVNKEYIQSMLKTEGNSLLLKDGSLIPVSKQKKEHLVKELNLLQH
jgi:two-component system LytT family response regulator